MTSIEKFHWLDQNSNYPNYVFARLRFDIRLDPQLAEQALLLALTRQPLAFKHPVLIGRRWHWVDNPNDRSYFESRKYNAEPSPWEFKSRKDLPFVAYHLSVLEFHSDQGWVSEARFCSHHAASDGVASIGLINDWLIIYNNLVGGIEPENGLNSIDKSKITSRGQLNLTSWNYLRRLPNQAIALFGAAKFIFRKTAKFSRLLPDSDSRSDADRLPAIVGRWISQPELDNALERAKSANVSFTSFCLGACFQAIDTWEREASSSKEPKAVDRPWRILLPMSIRGRHDRSLPAANQTAIVQIDRCFSNLNGATEFCQGIDREINIIRSWQLEKMFLIAIRVASISNGWLKKIANNPDSRGAAVFTHLGRPYRRARIHAGRLQKTSEQLQSQLAVPADFDLAGPIRSGTPLNLSFARQNNRFKISLHYDSKLILPADAERLLVVITDSLAAIKSLNQ